MKSEVIVQKSHRFGYEHAVRNCGVRLVEVETPEDLERSINSQTAMMMFLQQQQHGRTDPGRSFVARKETRNSHAERRRADVPPVDNCGSTPKMGFDLVAFSGGKGLRGPQSAGLLIGRKDLIAAARLNAPPNGTPSDAG